MKLFATQADLNAAIAEARAQALNEAKVGNGYAKGVYQSRGAWVITANAKGRAGPCEETGVYDDHKSKKSLDALIERILAYYPDVTEIHVEGGYDFAESPRDMHEGNYDPCVSDWDILIWERA